MSSHLINLHMPQDASLREENAMMLRRLHECELAAVGLQGSAGQQQRQRVHLELIATQNALNQPRRLDEVIRVEHQEQARAQ